MSIKIDLNVRKMQRNRSRTIFFSKGTHNVNEMVLDWDEDPIVIADNLYLSEYKLMDTWVNRSGISYTPSQYHYGHFGKVQSI